MSREQKRVKAIIDGVVQGVGFRWHARQTARRLRLSGYVRNRYDGTVEVVAEGSEYDLRQLVSYLHSGPSSAVVEGVRVEWLPASGEFNAFEVRF